LQEFALSLNRSRIGASAEFAFRNKSMFYTAQVCKIQCVLHSLGHFARQIRNSRLYETSHSSLLLDWYNSVPRAQSLHT
jgi:hypothetical protein